MNPYDREKTRVSFIGFGKRAKMFYAPILQGLDDTFALCGFTKRTTSNIEEISDTYGLDHYSSIDSLIAETNPDLLILPVPHHQTIGILNQINNFKGVIFVDSPVNFSTNENQNLNILASEQWPFLPIEQFKKTIIESGALGDIFYA